ncbi:DUF45 domain-containing protein [Catenovulum sp. 2E275]|uniref:YgjP-like metallopeptidase domain-containing protein n=1 Tax=Catenovulum sp. 2E275 TaxID=2980497 RepID=UPI0021D0871A|nr:YgjP-like metallopeptidase domain-containing protein [Catenovulum sp. 2E275]MCU4677516.1 DUF45 domain-containing protein [Catenovulum sp. 2E275]
MSAPKLIYLAHYPQHLQSSINHLLAQDKLADYLRNKYPNTHQINSDSALRDYTLALKNQYLKQSSPLSQVKFDNKIHVVNNALGLHTYKKQIQGNKLKSKNEIKISSTFKNVPEAFLNMIVVHELAHIKEKEHNKAFYKLCEYMQPDYHQLEFDMRVYLTHLEQVGEVY